jgi:hypothetical protein
VVEAAGNTDGDTTEEDCGYCCKPNQHLTLWVIPGTQGYRCPGATLMPGIDTFDACSEQCAVTQDGPPDW